MSEEYVQKCSERCLGELTHTCLQRSCLIREPRNSSALAGLDASRFFCVNVSLTGCALAKEVPFFILFDTHPVIYFWYADITIARLHTHGLICLFVICVSVFSYFFVGCFLSLMTFGWPTLPLVHVWEDFGWF